MNLDDTIVAIATPPGRGGIGVVRLAGPDARIIAAPMLRLTHPLEPGRAAHCELVEPTTQPSTRHFGTVDDLTELLHPVKPTPGLTGAPVRSAGQVGAPAATCSLVQAGARIDEVVVIYFLQPPSSAQNRRR